MNRELLSIIVFIVIAPIALICGALTWYNAKRRVTIRYATADDSEFVRRLYNRNRDWFGGTERVNKDEHETWYNDLLSNKRNLVLIGKVGNSRAGYLRVQNGVLSYCVARRYRGKGVASRMLGNAIFMRHEMTAKVLISNIASRRLLEKYGFVIDKIESSKMFVHYKKI
jgi:RimJ/RimL family protein N-acetyltransferase